MGFLGVGLVVNVSSSFVSNQDLKLISQRIIFSPSKMPILTPRLRRCTMPAFAVHLGLTAPRSIPNSSKIKDYEKYIST